MSETVNLEFEVVDETPPPSGIPISYLYTREEMMDKAIEFLVMIHGLDRSNPEHHQYHRDLGLFTCFIRNEFPDKRS